MDDDTEMTDEEIADAIEDDMTPEEWEEFDRHCWALVWEQAVLEGDLEGANWISQREEGRRDA